MRTARIQETPASLGFSMPAEWEPHEATWLAWPHNPTDWPGQAGHHPLGLRRDRAQDRGRRDAFGCWSDSRAEQRLARRYLERSGRRYGARRVRRCIPPTAAGRATAARCSCGAGKGKRAETAIVHLPLQRLGQVPRLAQGPPRARDGRQAPGQAAVRRAARAGARLSSKAAASMSTAAARC